MANLAWAENAVIIADDGRNVKYHPKCPHCGFVNTMQKGMQHVSGGGVTNAGGSHCTKCGKMFDLRFGRG